MLPSQKGDGVIDEAAGSSQISFIPAIDRDKWVSRYGCKVWNFGDSG